MTGVLTERDLWIATEPGNIGDLLVSILPTSLSVPTPDDSLALEIASLAAVSIPIATPLSTSSVHIDFATAIAVDAGDVLVVSLRHALNNTAEAFAWYCGGDRTRGPIDYTDGSWFTAREQASTRNTPDPISRSRSGCNRFPSRARLLLSVVGALAALDTRRRMRVGDKVTRQPMSSLRRRHASTTMGSHWIACRDRV
jgi:hypothetical protein